MLVEALKVTSRESRMSPEELVLLFDKIDDRRIKVMQRS